MNMGIACKLRTCREALDPLELLSCAGIVWCSTFEAHMGWGALTWWRDSSDYMLSMQMGTPSKWKLLTLCKWPCSESPLVHGAPQLLRVGWVAATWHRATASDLGRLFYSLPRGVGSCSTLLLLFITVMILAGISQILAGSVCLCTSALLCCTIVGTLGEKSIPWFLAPVETGRGQIRRACVSTGTHMDTLTRCSPNMLSSRPAFVPWSCCGTDCWTSEERVQLGCGFVSLGFWEPYWYFSRPSLTQPKKDSTDSRKLWTPTPRHCAPLTKHCLITYDVIFKVIF